MTLGKRYARRFALAARSGLRRLLGGKVFPQLSQEGWVTLLDDIALRRASSSCFSIKLAAGGTLLLATLLRFPEK
jgi:hypothetical protein